MMFSIRTASCRTELRQTAGASRLARKWRARTRGRIGVLAAGIRRVRPIPVLCCLLISFTATAACAAEAPATIQDDGFTLSCPVSGEGASNLDALAEKPYRPEWAPLPVLRGDAAIVPYLHELLSSPDAVFRARSAFLLGQTANPDSMKLLAERLSDPDRNVRVQSGIALACMGDARGIPVCAAALNADLPWIRYYAAYGLWCANTRRAEHVLRGVPSGHDELVNQAVQGALNTRYVAPPRVTPLPPNAKPSPQLSPSDIWEQAADVFVRESDWWWHSGDFHQAIRCLEVVLFLDPADVDSYGVIAWLQWSLGHDAPAIRTLKRGIAAAPCSPDAHFELGFHYMNTDRYALAEAPLRKAVELGDDQLVRRQYAHCLERLGKLDQSLEQWTAILEARRDDAAARRNYDRVKGVTDARAAGKSEAEH